jgi:hypothetical protein
LCKSFFGGYTQSVTVKARFLIFVSALIALAVCAPASRAQGHSRIVHLRTDVGCIAITAGLDQQLDVAGAQTHRRELAASPLKHHKPSTRSSRKRGKKISIQNSELPVTRCYSPGRYLISFASVARQHASGPNPSRGPPSFLSL